MPEDPPTPSPAGTIRSRGPYRTGVRRREQLLSATLDVFAESGYTGGSIRAIAERAGVSHATLLQHFGSKEGLLLAVLEEWDRRTVADGLTGANGLDYLRRLPEVMTAHRSHRGLLELFTTLAAEATGSTHPARGFIERRYARNLATLSDHVRTAARAGDIAPLPEERIEVEVRLLTAVLDGIGLQWLLDPSTDMAAAVATHVERTIAAWRSPLDDRDA